MSRPLHIRSSGASSSEPTKRRPGPWPKSSRGERATTWDWTCSACPSGSSAAGRPQEPCPGSEPSPPPTHKLRRAPTHGRTPPQATTPPHLRVPTIRLQAAQRARNTCLRWALNQTGMATNINTPIWKHLQLLLPSAHHTMLTNHTSREEGPLAVLGGDVHHHGKGTIDNI